VGVRVQYGTTAPVVGDAYAHRVPRRPPVRYVLNPYTSRGGTLTETRLTPLRLDVPLAVCVRAFRGAGLALMNVGRASSLEVVDGSWVMVGVSRIVRADLPACCLRCDGCVTHAPCLISFPAAPAHAHGHRGHSASHTASATHRTRPPPRYSHNCTDRSTRGTRVSRDGEFGAVRTHHGFFPCRRLRG